MEQLHLVLLLFGLAVMLSGLLAGFAGRSLLSLPAVFVLFGLVVGGGGLGLLPVSPSSPLLLPVVIVVLVLVLFRDGLEVDHELLETHWHLPLRKLVLAMPLTMLLVALLTHWLTPMDWVSSLLVGALLAPTDPVLSSGVVTNRAVPERLRHSLNLESGLNDGLALPVVLALLAALNGDRYDSLLRFVLQDIGLGLIWGVLVAALACRLPGLQRASKPQLALYLLGVALVAYGISGIPHLHGNGFIAVFVCAVGVGRWSPRAARAFVRGSRQLMDLAKLTVFVLFGAMVSTLTLMAPGWAGLAVVLGCLVLIRPLTVWLSLLGTSLDGHQRLFVGWFGPKGVATVAFSLLVLSESGLVAEPVFQLAALAVFCSVRLHGLTDHAGVRWVARREDASSPDSG